MKRGFAARRDTSASLHASAASASRKPTGFRFTFAGGKRFITDYVTIAREIAAATGGFYFTFCGAENFTTAERLFYILIFFKLVNLSGIYYDYIGETGFESTQRW